MIRLAPPKSVFRTLAFAFVATVSVGALCGQELEENWGNVTAKKALQDGSYPWYDDEADDLNHLSVEPQMAPPEAKEWEVDFPEWDIQSPNWNTTGFWEGVQYLIWGVMIALLVAVLVYFIRSFIRDGFQFKLRGETKTDSVTSEAEQIENLPFPVAKPRTDLLAEARHHYENGDYGRAIIYLFSYQLVHLDKHQLIRLAKGKTNRQYLREVGSPRSTIRNTLQQTMISFEEVFFGKHNLEKKAFEACWHRLEEFHQSVQRLAPAGV